MVMGGEQNGGGTISAFVGAGGVRELPAQAGTGDPPRAFWRGGDGGGERVPHIGRQPFHQGGEQGLLGGEVMQQPALGDASLGGGVGEGEAGHALGLDEAFGRIEDTAGHVGGMECCPCRRRWSRAAARQDRLDGWGATKPRGQS